MTEVFGGFWEREGAATMRGRVAVRRVAGEACAGSGVGVRKAIFGGNFGGGLSVREVMLEVVGRWTEEEKPLTCVDCVDGRDAVIMTLIMSNQPIGKANVDTWKMFKSGLFLQLNEKK